jgi:hypothetical protein
MGLVEEERQKGRPGLSETRRKRSDLRRIKAPIAETSPIASVAHLSKVGGMKEKASSRTAARERFQARHSENSGLAREWALLGSNVALQSLRSRPAKYKRMRESEAWSDVIETR